MIASSTMALPDVRAVISRPSRIGTPEETRVPSVRQNRATAIFFSTIPSTGMLEHQTVEVTRPL